MRKFTQIISSIFIALFGFACARQDSLYKAIEAGDTQQVAQLIANGADVNKRYSKPSPGSTPLMWAITKGNLDIVKLLLQAKADIHAQDKEGMTPLMVACITERPQIADMLIKEGANIHTANAGGATALLLSAYYGNLELVNLLVQAGADVNRADNQGATPIFLAANAGNNALLNSLIKAGANVNVMTSSDRKGTPLMEAVFQNKLETVKLLIQAGAKLDLQDSFG